MIPLIGILLCIYLVFKGFELFQIAWCAQDPPLASLIIGVVAAIASVVIAAIFAFLFISSAAITSTLPPVPPL